VLTASCATPRGIPFGVVFGIQHRQDINVAELPPGYRGISDEDQKKAKIFFDRGKTVSDTGNYDYAIEMYLQGLNIDPDSVEAHQGLREISLKRKASGGGALGMMARAGIKTNTKDDKQNMLGFEKLLAFDPPNLDYMIGLMQNAQRAGYYDTVMWIGPILLRANVESKKPDAKKFLVLKDAYKEIQQYSRAAEACKYALQIIGDNMDLMTELKDLGALDTMDKGGYSKGGDFRSTMRNREQQQDQLERDRDVVSEDAMTKAIREAEAEYKADPNEAGKVMKYAEALLRTEDMENENKAMEVLQAAYDRTQRFNFRQRIGKAQMDQYRRMERSMRQQLAKAPNDPQLRADYEQFVTDQREFELKEFTLWSEQYPTDLTLKYEMAARLFALKRYDEAIPLFQASRMDPKKKTASTIALGRSFLEAGFVDEAIETLQVIVDEYPGKGDDESKLMYYWQGRAYEQKGTNDMALKRYSQVAQWEFTYRDVQQRIKKLRAAGK
jgi:tetratricopeptide (TPR) repeat protein